MIFPEAIDLLQFVIIFVEELLTLLCLEVVKLWILVALVRSSCLQLLHSKLLVLSENTPSKIKLGSFDGVCGLHNVLGIWLPLLGALLIHHGVQRFLLFLQEVF